MIDLEEYEREYEELYNQPSVQKIKKNKSQVDAPKKKNKREQHISRADMWDEFLKNEESDDNISNIFKSEIPAKIEKKKDSKNFTEKKPFNFTGEHVHLIKNVQINFDGVADIQKIQNTHNNVETYGIKFIFKSKNNTYRIIWFNQNEKERDDVFKSEFDYWRSFD